MKKTDGIPLAQAILFAAIKTFVEHGYDNASMDEIAASASTTKRTVYSHYGSKEALFRSALEKAVELFQSEMPKLSDLDDPARELERFAVGFGDLATWRGAVQLQRVVMGGASRFADLGAMLHRDIIEHAERIIADYLRSLDDRHPRQSGNKDYAVLASIFLNMTTGPQRFATLLEARAPLPEHPLFVIPSDHGREAVREAVHIFLHGSGFSS